MATAAASFPRSVSDSVPFTSLTIVDDEPIGFGGFGAVYNALHQEWGVQVAYKKLAVSYIGKRSRVDQQLLQRLKYEAEIHCQLRHPNIVSMLGVVFEENNYGIILEFVAYGSWIDFLNVIRHESGMSCVPCILKIKLSHEIASGMSYLHSLNIIHCDLKLQNVLITEHINAKLSDFGLSKWKDFSRSHTNTGMNQGTPSHISPEQWKDMNHRPCDKSDVYSFSIVLWEFFTESQAYEGRGDFDPLSLVRTSPPTILKDIQTKPRPKFGSFISSGS